ncbi:hypothetical protein OMR07_02755 [Methylobacterium organophilum]|nr:hypothetical protein [Methylobacterium organophilum]
MYGAIKVPLLRPCRSGGATSASGRIPMPNNKKPRVAWCARSVLLMTVLLFPSTSLQAAQSLTLLTWEEFLGEAVIERWQAETGVEILQIYFDSGDKRDEVLAKTDHQVDVALTELISSSRFGARCRAPLRAGAAARAGPGPVGPAAISSTRSWRRRTRTCRSSWRSRSASCCAPPSA